MSGCFGDFLNEPTTAVFEPSAHIFVGELVTNVLVVVFVEARVTADAHDDTFEVMIHAGWEGGKAIYD